MRPSDDPRLAAVMREAGVTRLAELTGLDRIGLPVWQAVRPWSRALSVHQGKGLDDATARRGAVMEAIESHHAEQWRPRVDVHQASWAALPPASRSPAADDWGVARGAIDPDAVLDWIAVEPLGGCAPFRVPVDCVGLDCTADSPPGLLRHSNGQAAHFERDAAILSALLELIERDAMAEWLAGSAVGRGGWEIDVASVADASISGIVASLVAQRTGVRLYRIPAIVPLPVFVAEVAAWGHPVAPHEHVWGAAAALDPVDAATRALAEALQTRCSQIAGSRDTIPMGADQASVIREHIALPSRPGWRGHPFEDGPSAIHALSALVAALRARGYAQIGYIELSPANAAAVTVKAFVPGLADHARRRRDPA